MIIFCCTEFHRVLHGVTQSFFFSFVLLCDNFLLHRVTRSFARSFTEFFFSFVLLYITFLLHRVSQSFARSYTEFFYFVLLCDNFLLHRPSQSVIVSSVLLCEYSVVLCETFFLLHIVSQSVFSPLCYSVSTLWDSVKLFF